MKNILDEINDRWDIAEEVIIELEDIVIKTIWMKQRKMTKKTTENKSKSISEYLIFLTMQVYWRWDESFQFLPVSKCLYFDFIFKGYFY